MGIHTLWFFLGSLSGRSRCNEPHKRFRPQLGEPSVDMGNDQGVEHAAGNSSGTVLVQLQCTAPGCSYKTERLAQELAMDLLKMHRQDNHVQLGTVPAAISNDGLRTNRANGKKPKKSKKENELERDSKFGKSRKEQSDGKHFHRESSSYDSSSSSQSSMDDVTHKGRIEKYGASRKSTTSRKAYQRTEKDRHKRESPTKRDRSAGYKSDRTGVAYTSHYSSQKRNRSTSGEEDEAITLAKEDKNAIIFICGSLYLCGEVLNIN